MKPAYVLMTLTCALAAQSVFADDQPVAPMKMTCEQFTQLDDAYRPALVYWVAGVDKLGIKETDRVVVDTAHPVGEIVATECKKDPNAPFVKKVRSMIKSNQISLFDHH
ncbi:MULTISPECIES: HdeA/HdeB family chaperone [unclassified Caballeronia]|uniref:HdeA/HdeB family chaperone n=1 Tax=unclassified Caballeronia TaxID=2646786 RepID=UPI0028568D06|nr:MULTISPECIES: HdeA/HdeB family chaperone [unclassified Caballeronia]MDR5816364.1 HdeA/HdeB family chaperone [Caballeronia sp. LZ033]MDR5823030.1 HdeA/HdeB family chaperone [Caballeronia sp. LZ043]MDR5881162.1 HdeA/HdeB family chaperone [Caballeronia sp. LZ032]